MNRDRIVHVGYTWEDCWDGRAYDFRVEGVVEAFTPARMHGGPDDLGSPPEGGGCEITDANLVNSSDVLRAPKAVENAFWTWLLQHPEVMGSLEEKLRTVAVADAACDELH